mmetsp:Transcript_112713/g.318520  ORF Transcript_112713/g.318520 Transcript_112713/m.318520 type:complete len:349 (+) Transcript_112713:206-1252(+)
MDVILVQPPGFVLVQLVEHGQARSDVLHPDLFLFQQLPKYELPARYMGRLSALVHAIRPDRSDLLGATKRLELLGFQGLPELLQNLRNVLQPSCLEGDATEERDCGGDHAEGQEHVEYGEKLTGVTRRQDVSVPNSRHCHRRPIKSLREALVVQISHHDGTREHCDDDAQDHVPAPGMQFAELVVELETYTPVADSLCLESCRHARKLILESLLYASQDETNSGADEGDAYKHEETPEHPVLPSARERHVTITNCGQRDDDEVHGVHQGPASPNKPIGNPNGCIGRNHGHRRHCLALGIRLCQLPAAYNLVLICRLCPKRNERWRKPDEFLQADKIAVVFVHLLEECL